MKLKTSFCNATVLKKGITRFLPVWVIYLICGLLTVSTISGNYLNSVASTVHGCLSFAMPYITCGYAIVVALLLFGDLYTSRLCTALHAMPLRRESWFCTHFIAGILMALVPDLIMALVLMPMLGSLWYIALIWVGGSMLMYLFFFGLASLCCMATGNKFAALLVYGLVNLFSLELLWMTDTLIMPFLNGVRLRPTVFYRLCPLAQLLGNNYFSIGVTYADVEANSSLYGYTPHNALVGFGEGWLYLFVLAVIGVGMAVVALCLYRKRQLEVAGNFAAIAPVRWAISIFGSLMCGMIFRMFAINETMRYIFLFVGIVVGFFLLQMLLQRKVKIFSKASFIKCTALVLIFALILVLGAMDILGLETYVPKADQVQSVLVVNANMANDQMDQMWEKINKGTYSGSISHAAITDPEQIQTVLDAHSSAITENCHNNGTYVTIHYRLKNNRSVTRNYFISRMQEAYTALSPLFCGARFPFAFDDIQSFSNSIIACWANNSYLPENLWPKLAESLWSDAQKGILNSVGSAGTYALEIRYISGIEVDNEILYIGSECSTYALLNAHSHEFPIPE